ncbi:MAG: peptide ABC transporter substrate-binding protein [Gaiellaceae bacterium]
MKAALALALAVVAGAAGSAPASQAATPRRGGTVVVALSQEPTCLNPLSSTCRSAGVGYLAALNQVLEGAFEIGPDLTYRENLISSWEVTNKPFTVTYHIRPEASWSDGVPVTAGDFIFTYRKMLKNTGAYHWERILKFRTLNKKTLRVVFRVSDPDWREAFHWVLPRHVFAGEDPEAIWQDAIDNPKTGESIGSGPFLVERFERGRQLALVRNPRYWGPRTAYLDRIVFRFVAPDQLAESLRRGDVDVIAPGITESGAAALEFRQKPAAGVTVVSGRGTFWQHLDFRVGAGGHPALKRRLVRQALAYGIDRKAIVRKLGDLDLEPGSAVTPLDSVVFGVNSPFYRPNWSFYRYRPAEAQRLLGQAGCRPGADGIYACEGERLSLRAVTTAGVERRELQLRLVQSQLRRVGVDVQLEFVPSRVFFGTTLRSGDFDMALFAWGRGASLAGAYDVFGCKGVNNDTGYCSGPVHRDLVQTVRILDLEQRVRVLNQVDVKLAKDVPVIPLFQPPFLTALRARLRGVVPNDAEGFTWNSEDWWLSR